jgi:hypothetical protein
VANNEPNISFEQPRSTFGTWLGIVLLFAIFGVFVWVVMGAMPRGDNYERKRSEARVEKLKTAREEYKKASEGYGWVDKEKGVARIPVQRAMEVAMADLAQRKPMPANPIDPGAGEKAGQQVTAPMAPTPGPVSTPQPDTTPKATAVTGKDSENRGQPAAANNPPDAAPGTQPGPDATPAASPPLVRAAHSPAVPIRVRHPSKKRLVRISQCAEKTQSRR